MGTYNPVEMTMRHLVLLLLGLGACAYAPTEDALVVNDNPTIASYRAIDTSVRRLSEDQACQAVVASYQKHGLELGCVTTIHACPDLLRFSFGIECLQYLPTPVADCVITTERARSCEELYASSCQLVPAWGSDPAGCDAEAQVR